MPPKRDGGRAGFLDARRSAAISETIKKEERTLHNLLQKQIELGRIVLPEEEEQEQQVDDDADGGADDSAVGRQLEWLLAAHRRAGHQLDCPATLQADRKTQQGEGGATAGAAASGGAAGAAAGAPHARAAQAGQPGSAAASGNGADEGEEDEEAEAAALQQRMRDISRSLWSTLSSGTASGSVAFPSSRTKADYAYNQAAVAAMHSSGELETRHHRRRDEHSKYMEASARDAALRRGSTAYMKDS